MGASNLDLARTSHLATLATFSAMQRIGVDAVSVERIELAVKRSGTGFLTRVYTPAELAYCAGSAERLAGRWAAKEAVIKCFDGTGICFPRKQHHSPQRAGRGHIPPRDA